MRVLRFLRRCTRLVTHSGYRRRFEFGRLRCAAGLYKLNDDEQWVLYLFGTWVQLWRAATAPKDCMCDSWSFDFKPFSERYLCLHWGAKCKFIHMPWSFDWVETARMDFTGRFRVTEYNDRGKHASIVLANPLEEQSYPFAYVTKLGEYQSTTVTVRSVTRHTWQWALFRRLRLPLARKVDHSLDLAFADEMGNERSSWKGGVIGTGCFWQPGENIEHAVRRFEQKCVLENSLCR